MRNLLRLVLVPAAVGMVLLGPIGMQVASAGNDDTSYGVYHGYGDGTDNDHYMHPFNHWNDGSANWSSLSVFWTQYWQKGASGTASHFHFNYYPDSVINECKMGIETSAPYYHYHWHHSRCW